MDGSSEVARKVLRFKLQLSDAGQSATKLKDLDITLDILAETGIGKAVNSLRRHEQAGELAKSLVRGWKKLLPKDCTSLTEDGDVSEAWSVKDKLKDQDCPNAGALTTEDLNNNCVTSHSKSQDSSDAALFKAESKKADMEKQQCEEQKGKKKENPESQQENQLIFQSDVFEKKTEGDKMDSFAFRRKKNDPSERKEGDGNPFFGNNDLEDTHQRKTFKLSNVRDGESPRISKSSQAQKRKRKKTSKEGQDGLEHKQESENKGHSTHKNKKAKIKHKGKEGEGVKVDTSKSFEAYLNYDVSVSKRKERGGAKKPSKTAEKEAATKHSDNKPPVTSENVSPPKQRFQESFMDLINIPLPAALPECEQPSCVEYFDSKVERESDFCDVSEESAGFTGQRLNKKMQVYSGAKTVFLPAMLSLYQQCIRTLQNNINLLYETGGVPFEILEPVLERCTPEQLLRIEEFNPIYIGVTDHIWGKHCQRNFKDSRLQEYESWKEMYIRLSEERERKLQRLTKSIVSANSNKPKGRQVKMAFIHTVAKPPRDVRIQQEIHGTAVQQPHQPKCSASVKVEDSRLRPSCNEPSRSSGSSSGGSNAQDPRKKTRVAPMMAKSLKAFKKQLGRR
ncbi:putative transcription elongation factor B polypeptide 3-like [Scophthalmus maximus]|uniref:Putative transcription elongation factor B polypeptide 3-like n=1 Tax=Scophthalmus maximus TaxID=52904 RepID=A0A2U9CEA8_SCOMX|nr:putative transcription elongation factor B polypeptide 3-like [Scophthalmus maximus]